MKKLRIYSTTNVANRLRITNRSALILLHALNVPAQRFGAAWGWDSDRVDDLVRVLSDAGFKSGQEPRR